MMDDLRQERDDDGGCRIFTKSVKEIFADREIVPHSFVRQIENKRTLGTYASPIIYSEDWTKDFFDPDYVESFYLKNDVSMGDLKQIFADREIVPHSFVRQIENKRTLGTYATPVIYNEDWTKDFFDPDYVKSFYLKNDLSMGDLKHTVLGNKYDMDIKSNVVPNHYIEDDTFFEKERNMSDNQAHPQESSLKDHVSTSKMDNTVSDSYSFESYSSDDQDYVHVYSQENCAGDKFLQSPYQTKGKYEYDYTDQDASLEVYQNNCAVPPKYLQAAFPENYGLTVHDSRSSVCSHESVNDSISSVNTPETQTSENSSAYIQENALNKYPGGHENRKHEIMLQLPLRNINSKESCDKILNYFKNILMLVSESSMINIKTDSEVLLKSVFVKDSGSCKIHVGIVDMQFAAAHLPSDFQTQFPDLEDTIISSSEVNMEKKRVTSVTKQPDKTLQANMESHKPDRWKRGHQQINIDESGSECSNEKAENCESENGSFIKSLWSILVPENHGTTTENTPAAKEYNNDHEDPAERNNKYKSNEEVFHQVQKEMDPSCSRDCSPCSCYNNQPVRSLPEQRDESRSAGHKTDNIHGQLDPRSDNYGYGWLRPSWLAPSDVTRWVYPHPYEHGYPPQHLPASSTDTAEISPIASPAVDAKEPKISTQIEPSKTAEAFKVKYPIVNNRKRSLQKHSPRWRDTNVSNKHCFQESTSFKKPLMCVPKQYTTPRYEWLEKYQQKYCGYSVPFIDSHCHLDILFKRERFVGSFTEYIGKHEDTVPRNFIGCIAVFCHPLSFTPRGGMWLKMAKVETRIHIALGCHPKNIEHFDHMAYRSLKECMQHPRVVALGEIGLDYSGTFHHHKEQQKVVFIQQLKLALEVKKPLVIHCRDAEDDCLEIMKRIVPRNYRIHRHCFTGNFATCQKWLRSFTNLYIGLTPVITYNSARPAQDVVKYIPLDRLLLETDAPYFVPNEVPKTEQPFSHPGMAIAVAIKVANLRNIAVNTVLEHCLKNTKTMYGIKNNMSSDSSYNLHQDNVGHHKYIQ